MRRFSSTACVALRSLRRSVRGAWGTSVSSCFGASRLWGCCGCRPRHQTVAPIYMPVGSVPALIWRLDGPGTLFRAVAQSSCIPTPAPSFTGWQVPDWEQLLRYATRAFDAVPLGYFGVDLVVDGGSARSFSSSTPAPGWRFSWQRSMGCARSGCGSSATAGRGKDRGDSSRQGARARAAIYR